MRKYTHPTESPIADVAVDPSALPAIALVTLALELGDVTTAELVTRLGGDVFVEPSSGLRCVSVEVCRRVIDEHAAAERRRAAAMFEAEAKLLAMQPPPMRYVKDERLEALTARGFTGGGQS